MEEERQAAPAHAGTGSDAAQTSPDDVEPPVPVQPAGPARPISVVPGVAAARASVPGALRPNPAALRAATWPSGESKIYGARPRHPRPDSRGGRVRDQTHHRHGEGADRVRALERTRRRSGQHRAGRRTVAGTGRAAADQSRARRRCPSRVVVSRIGRGRATPARTESDRAALS